jgi:hypothetical protein
MIIKQVTFDYIEKEGLSYAETFTVGFPAELSSMGHGFFHAGKEVKKIEVEDKNHFKVYFEDGIYEHLGTIHGISTETKTDKHALQGSERKPPGA